MRRDYTTIAMRELRPYAGEPLTRAAGLGELMPTVLKGLGLDQKVWESQIFEKWREIVGDATASVSRPISLRHGTLVVGVEHSGYLMGLRPLIPQMLRQVQQRIGKTSVRKIILRVG